MTESLSTALDPVRLALLAEGVTQAERAIADAEAASKTTIDQATSDAQSSVDDTIERQRLTTAAAGDQELARLRQESASKVLAAQSAAHQRLVTSTHDAFLALRHDANYPALLDWLTNLAIDRLGADATIDRDPELVGGVVATLGSRLVDFSMPMLADRALDALADRVAEVWA